MIAFLAKFRKVSPVARGDRARDGGLWREAARHYRTALARTPENAPIWIQYGHALKESGALASAEAAYRRAVALDPSADAHLQLGHLLKIRGRPDEAEAAYICAIVYDPALTDARSELASFGWSDTDLTRLSLLLGGGQSDRTKAAAVEAMDAAPNREMLRRQLLDSGLFDPIYYAAQNRDVADMGVDPLDHYIDCGAGEGRNPSADFDAAVYIDIFPATAGRNPLLHYLEVGEKDSRAVRAVRPLAAPTTAASLADWQGLAQQISALPVTGCQVDVIVPVYRGLDETAGCLFALISSRLASQTRFEVVAIDDCSPQPELRRLLCQLADLGLLTLVTNEQNRGFVETANRGMSLHHDRDVVLLNSDTEVYNDWIDRLRHACLALPAVGTATPLSNNATICSYPQLCQNFRFQFEIPFDELDRLASDVNHREVVDIPTAVGFCMYIRRECLDEVGLFDTVNFGLGYGEENDFCCRIAAKGWRNVLAADVFVRHLGRASFGGTAPQREQNAIKMMDRLHPSYLSTIASFCRRDPVMPVRRRLDVARLRRGKPDRGILMVLHNRGGGTQKHVNDLCRSLERAGVASYVLQPLRSNGNLAAIAHPGCRDIPNIGFVDVKHGLTEAAELFRELGVFHIHVHHLADFTRDALHFFPALCRALNIDYDVTFHDYLAVCPRITMIDGSGIFCGNSDLSTCETCVRRNGSPFGDVGVGAWRADYEGMLRSARRLFAPDEDVAERLQSLMPGLPLTLRPHPEALPELCGEPVPRNPGDVLRVAVIGAIGEQKGSKQLQHYAEDAARRKLPIMFVVFGYCDIPGMADLANVEIIGHYRSEDLPRLLARRPCHLAFLPSVSPETYSYVLSEALFAGLFPVAFDIGAPARRIRACGWGLVVPFHKINHASEVNDALLACEVPQMPDRVWEAVTTDYGGGNLLAAYYGLA